LERDPPPSRAIREECLEFLGASLLFQGASREGAIAFERLLVLEPDWELDPAIFPTPILDEFARVKNEMRERLEALQAAELQIAEIERQRRIDEDRVRREALAEALEPRYLVHEGQNRSLFLALVPFGVGQFQNDQDTKGWTLFGLEAALFAANAWTFLSWDWYTRESHAVDSGAARRQQAADYADGYKIASWAILGALLATMVAGVIDSLVFYEAASTDWRLVPPDQIPEHQRLPPRSPDDFLPPLDDPSVPARSLDAAAPPVSLSLSWSF
jgi:hypothetical protein